MLYAHGYNPKNLNLSKHDLQLLLPAILNTVENPGCERQLPPVKRYPLLNSESNLLSFDLYRPFLFYLEWVFGILLILFMKLIHFLVFSLSGEHSSALTTSGINRTLSNHAEALKNPSADIRLPPIKYHLWLGLGFNAFTCGIILGTVIYHLIPHVKTNDFIRLNFAFYSTRSTKFRMKILVIRISFVEPLFSSEFSYFLSSKNYFDFDSKLMK